MKKPNWSHYFQVPQLAWGELSKNELALLGWITSTTFSRDGGSRELQRFCFDNKQMAEYLNMLGLGGNSKTVSKYVFSLKEKGYIDTQKQGKMREIFLCKATPTQESTTPTQESTTPTQEYSTDAINNKEIKIKNNIPPSPTKNAQLVLDEFQSKIAVFKDPKSQMKYAEDLVKRHDIQNIMIAIAIVARAKKQNWRGRWEYIPKIRSLQQLNANSYKGDALDRVLNNGSGLMNEIDSSYKQPVDKKRKCAYEDGYDAVEGEMYCKRHLPPKS